MLDVRNSKITYFLIANSRKKSAERLIMCTCMRSQSMGRQFTIKMSLKQIAITTLLNGFFGEGNEMNES